MIAGQDTLGTWKVRAPTYTNLQCVPTILSGAQIADGPIGYASLDPCLSCTSRAVVVDKKTRKKTILTNKELHEISVEKTRKLKGS
jgi:membrane-bound hydrogenase subunit alpha